MVQALSVTLPSSVCLWLCLSISLVFFSFSLLVSMFLYSHLLSLLWLYTYRSILPLFKRDRNNGFQAFPPPPILPSMIFLIGEPNRHFCLKIICAFIALKKPFRFFIATLLTNDSKFWIRPIGHRLFWAVKKENCLNTVAALPWVTAGHLTKCLLLTCLRPMTCLFY